MRHMSKREMLQSALNLPAFTGWLERQPSDVTYTYVNNQDCLICRYLKDCGFEDITVTPTEAILNYQKLDQEIVRLPRGMNDIAFGRLDAQSYTMGAALERARSYERKPARAEADLSLA